MLVYRARLDATAEAILSVTVRVRPAPAGLATLRPAGHCLIQVRYVTPGGAVRRHRGALTADLPRGARLRAAAWQIDGADLLLTLLPARAAPSPGPARGAAVADRFALPVGLEAWGTTAVSAVTCALRLHARERASELQVRGVLHLTLATPGGTLRRRIPFLRMVAVPHLPPGLRWSTYGGVSGVQLRVEPGGRITGEVRLSLRYVGRSAASSTKTAIQRLHEVAGRIVNLCAEPAGDGHSTVRGTVELDLYGSGAGGVSRWEGRSLPFSDLLPVAGDRLEPFAGALQLRHDQQGIQAHFEAGVTALCRETLEIQGRAYRAERVTGTAATTLLLTEPLQPETPRMKRMAEQRAAFLPLVGPAEGWEELTVNLKAAPAQQGRWTVSARLGGAPAGEAPYPAPLRAQTGGSSEGEAVPALESADATGLRLRTVLLHGLTLIPAPQAGAQVQAELPLPGPTKAVTGLAITVDGDVTALIKTDTQRIIKGRLAAALAGRPIAATAYPLTRGDRWQMCIIVTLEKALDSGAQA